MRTALAVTLMGCSVGAISPRMAVDRVAYPNGKARFEFELREGIPNGRGRAWYPNGKLASDGTYQDGARHGQFWLYNEDGTLAALALYVDNAEVWRSTDQHQEPPEAWSGRFVLEARPAPSDAMLVDREPEPEGEEDQTALRPYFSTLDRTTAPARVGAQVGVGDAEDLGFGAATRLDVFGHYRIGPYGVFAQLSETRLALTNDMTLGGRRAAIVAGTYHHVFGPATLSTSGGFIATIGNADAPSSVASYVGAEQRPADAAVAIPAPFAVRSAASLTASRDSFFLQLDAGIDWLLGGDEHGFGALGRANAGLGFGLRSAVLTAEFDNSLSLSGAQAQIHALAFGGSFASGKVWFSGSFVVAASGTTSLLGSVGHDL